MAAQEIILKFRGDSAQLKTVMAEVRTDITKTFQTQKTINQSGAAEARKLAGELRRFERERETITKQTSKAIERQAKTEADARIREGRRAANAVIAQLQEEVRQARATQSQIAASRAGGSSFLAGAAGGLSALVGVSAVNEIREAAAAWLDYSSKLETTKIAFTTMLGSAELAQAHLNELQAFALKTPFQFGELIDASQRMQALGFSAQQVIPILTDVGNAVAAAGGGSERLDRVVLALSQMQSKGKVASQELNQLAESGISGFKILEEHLGKSRAELVKMVEQGQISSAVFLEAFQKFSQQNFGGLMEAQSKTFTGAMSNIKDALLQTSNTAFQPLYDRLTELARRMADTSTKSKEFRKDMEEVGKALAQMWDGAVLAIHLLHDAYRLVMAAIVGQIGLTIHSFQALARAIQSAFFALEAWIRLGFGDFVGAARAIEKSNQQARLSVLEMRDALISAGSAWRELSNIMDHAGDRALAAAQKTAAAAAILTAQAALTGANVLGVGVAVSAGITRPKAVSIATGGGGKKAAADTTLQNATREAALTEREALILNAADVAENKRALDEQVRDIEEFTRRAIELADARQDVVITRINSEQEALDLALQKKLIKQQEYNVKSRELTIQNAEADQKNTEETFRLEQDRDRRLAEARIAAKRRELQIAEDADQRQIKRIENRIDEGVSLESEGQREIGVIIDEALARRLAALTEEEDAYSTTLERRKDINAEIIRLDGERAASAEETARRVAKAQFDEQNAAAEGATRPRLFNDPKEFIGLNPFNEAIRLANEQFGIGTLNAQLFTAALQGIDAAASATANAVGEMTHAFVLYGTAGQSFRKVAAQIIASLASQAIAQAAYQLASGLAMSALFWFTGNPKFATAASFHYLAAAAYGAVGGVAALAGRAVAGNAFNNAVGGGQDSESNRGSSQQLNPLNLERSTAPQVVRHVHVLQIQSNDSHIVEAIAQNYQGGGVIRELVLNDGAIPG